MGVRLANPRYCSTVRLLGSCGVLHLDLTGHRSSNQGGTALLEQGDGAFGRCAQRVQLGCLCGDVGDDGVLFVQRRYGTTRSPISPR